eukprot:4472550-Amphidinium_carterae.6
MWLGKAFDWTLANARECLEQKTISGLCQSFSSVLKNCKCTTTAWLARLQAVLVFFNQHVQSWQEQSTEQGCFVFGFVYGPEEYMFSWQSQGTHHLEGV